jgi:hypothetical protein
MGTAKNESSSRVYEGRRNGVCRRHKMEVKANFMFRLLYSQGTTPPPPKYPLVRSCY